MKALRTIFGKVFGRSVAREPNPVPTDPGRKAAGHAPAQRPGAIRSPIFIPPRLKSPEWKKSPPKGIGFQSAGDGRYTRKTRDSRPPAVRYAERFPKERDGLGGFFPIPLKGGK